MAPPSHFREQSCGQVAEWLKAADCKSARASVRWFESSPVHHQPFSGSIIAFQGMAEFLDFQMLTVS